MRLGDRTRRWLMRGACAGLLIAVSALIGLRIGRPLYYTDGAGVVAGHTLAASGLVRWSTPEVLAELPGPVQGRVARLSDGRLLYGRTTSDGTTDLVLFDPLRPSLPPEPAHGLNTGHNELAPALGPGGRLYFASDRPGGAGGYDLWVAAADTTGFGEPLPFVACNSAMDETDPAPHGNGRDFVFVRIDPQQKDRGALFHRRLDGANEPARVFAGFRGEDRDPVFAPAGGALWFVRRPTGGPLMLVRAGVLDGRFDEPQRIGASWGGSLMRSPTPDPSGRLLGLLQPARGENGADLWYRATAEEVVPWWLGQRWIETLLALISGLCSLLLVLLHLGRRWATMDLLAQCLLLSLLLHVLLFLVLAGVEITSSVLPGDDEEGAIEVTLVAAATHTAGGQQAGDVAARVEFAPLHRPLTAETPGAAPERVATMPVAAAEAQPMLANAEARQLPTEAAVQDAAATAVRREGEDTTAAPTAARLPPVDKIADPVAAERAGAAEATLQVGVPGATVERVAAAPSMFAPAVAERPFAERAVAEGAVAAAHDVAEPALHDEIRITPRPAPAADAEAASAAARQASPTRRERGVAAGPATPTQPLAAGTSASRAPAPAEPSRVALSAPGSHLQRAEVERVPTAPATRVPLAAAVQPQRRAVAVELHDEQAEAVRQPRADSPAAKSTARSPARSPATAGAKSTGAAAPLAVAMPAAPAASAAPAPSRSMVRAPTPVPVGTALPPRSTLERATRAPAVAPQAAPTAPPTVYSRRFGPAKQKAIEQFGGSADTERAVANGLRYLARIQSADGSWGNRDHFDGKYGQVYVGKTALCLLAFLGAGHTPVSGTEHSRTVQQALQHLLAIQDEDTGAFGPSSCYGHGIATYALAECYGMTKDNELQRPLEEALTWILQHQGPRRDKRNRGGWGYFSPGLDPEDSYARVSVTAWMVMALESARLSGVDLPPEVLPKAREYLEAAYDAPNGWFRYNHKPSRLQSSWPTLPASTPAAAFCLMLLGAAADDPMVRAGVEYTVERRPEEYRPYDDDEFVTRGQGNVYFWYYGTLCSFLAGGDGWDRWNKRLSTVLPAAQSADGSWAPIDVYARHAGDTRRERSYTTAMCVLSLEIYYRYFTPLLLGR